MPYTWRENFVGKFDRLEDFLAERRGDIIAEPQSEPHTTFTKDMTRRLLKGYDLPAGSRVLDVGCGQGQALAIFRDAGLDPVGLTFGEDLQVCRDKGFDVHEMDQSFLDFDDQSFDAVWCRHTLEHSIFPFFTLAGFYRVMKPDAVLYVEVPAPETACRHENHPNHYSVLPKSGWVNLITRTGFVDLAGIDIDFESPAGPDVYWAFFARRPTP